MGHTHLSAHLSGLEGGIPKWWLHAHGLSSCEVCFRVTPSQAHLVSSPPFVPTESEPVPSPRPPVIVATPGTAPAKPSGMVPLLPWVPRAQGGSKHSLGSVAGSWNGHCSSTHGPSTGLTGRYRQIRSDRPPGSGTPSLSTTGRMGGGHIQGAGRALSLLTDHRKPSSRTRLTAGLASLAEAATSTVGASAVGLRFHCGGLLSCFCAVSVASFSDAFSRRQVLGSFGMWCPFPVCSVQCLRNETGCDGGLLVSASILGTSRSWTWSS